MLRLGYQSASRVRVGSVHDAVPTRTLDCRRLLMPPSFVPVDDPVDALFALPPSEFTAARNALVKQLRGEKRRDEAEAVKALKRPSVPAWALNQVARRDPDAIEAVIEAGAAVGTAQRRALSGVRDSGLREASQQRRERIDAVWQKAAAALREAGTQPATHRQTVAATLEAASVDPEAAQLVRDGRLSADLPAPSGFGDVAGFALVPQEADADAGQDASEAPQPEAPEDHDAAAREALAEAQRQLDAANRRAEELADRAADARRAAVRTADEAERAERRATQLRRRAGEEASTAEELAEQAEAMQRQTEKAAVAVEEARAALESAS